MTQEVALPMRVIGWSVWVCMRGRSFGQLDVQGTSVKTSDLLQRFTSSVAMTNLLFERNFITFIRQNSALPPLCDIQLGREWC